MATKEQVHDTRLQRLQVIQLTLRDLIRKADDVNNRFLVYLLSMADREVLNMIEQSHEVEWK